MNPTTTEASVQSSNTESRHSWVDAMRGIAILMVIAVHAGHGLKGYESFVTQVFGFGGYGVQLFFVASAMTLCMSMEKNLGKPQWLVKYAIRRFFRIAPMYYVGILAYLLWSCVKNYVQSGALTPLPQYTAINVLANVFFVHGFFPQAYNQIVPGGWSIAVEMLFYVFFPAVFLLYRRSMNVWGTTAILLVLCYLAAWLVQALLQQNTVSSDFLYFNIANQFQVFVIGIAAFHLWPKLTAWNRMGAVGLALVMGLVGNWIWPQPILNARFLALAAYSGTFVGLAILLFKAQISSTSLLVEIGRRSFSMYIVHFAFMNIIEYVFNIKFNLLAEHLNLKALFHLGAAVALTYWVSGWTKRLIEDRFIQIGTQVATRTHLLAFFSQRRNGDSAM